MNTEKFLHKLQESGIQFFTGVPDSLLKDFGNCVYQHIDSHNHVIAANEGNAVALATGSYLSTGHFPLVYLQNAGLGNIVNPLLSMADPSLYAIPMIIMVGWRGKNGEDDAEQHLKQGLYTLPIIDTMNYPYCILSKDEQEAFSQIDTAITSAKQKLQPYFIVVEKDSFDTYTRDTPPPLSNMKREEALKIIAQHMPDSYFVVTTTGKTSREWYEVREQLQHSHNKDFLTVGSMGHTSSIALGMALQSKQHIVCIDGDGSMLMHLGAMIIAGAMKIKNFHYILINNYSHESVGGLPTLIEHVNFTQFFHSIGFANCFTVSSPEELNANITNFITTKNTVLEVRVKQGSRKDLSRPTTTSHQLAKILRDEFSAVTEKETK